jgi:hypothetical protein
MFGRGCAEGMDPPPEVGRRRTNVANMPPYLGQLPPIIQCKRLHLQGQNQASNHPAIQVEDCPGELIR